MPETPPADNSGRDQAGRFRPGASGNPAGKRRGSRNRTSIMLDALASQHAETVVGRVIVAAAKGDMTAAGLLLSRIWPVPKSRRVRMKLPELTSAADGAAALATLVAATARGELAPDEAGALAGLIRAHGDALALTDIEVRLARLEAAAGGDAP
jgi:hypothetical protein